MDPIISADKAWVKDLEYVLSYGNRVSPRGMPVYESIAYQSVISMVNPIILNNERKLGYRFMAAEAAWILSGDNRVDTIRPYSKDIAQFSDDGVTFFGAYGPKIYNQFPYIVNTLQKDIHSRQAVINIWREEPGPSKDIPCTLSLQFLLRDGVLHCVASMRSSDLWLGHPYDIVNFSAVSFALLLQLNKVFEHGGEDKIKLGYLFLTAGSKHIYERNREGVEEVLAAFHEEGEPVEAYRRVLFDHTKYDDINEFVVALWDCANSNGGLLRMYGD